MRATNSCVGINIIQKNIRLYVSLDKTELHNAYINEEVIKRRK